MKGSSISQIVDTQIAVSIDEGMLNVLTQLSVQASVSHQKVTVVTVIFLTIVEINDAVSSVISNMI